MILENQIGPSGVPLGGLGVGYYEIDPTGRVTRTCINNIHISFVDTPDGFLVGVYDGSTAVRLQRDNQTVYGMKGYADSYYTGLWPKVTLEFENSGAEVSDMGFSAYSGVVAHNIKDSSLPVVYYEVKLYNDSDTTKDMSAILTWGDIIGRGIRDNTEETVSNWAGDAPNWRDMATPATYAKGVTLDADTATYVGVLQYAKEPLLPNTATFQNYNNAFMILAEQTADADITILKRFGVDDQSALSSYVENGALSDYDEDEVALSSADPDGNRVTESGSAVAVSVPVEAGQTRIVRFAVSWFMPEITGEQYAEMRMLENGDYNKYYHNDFSTIEELTAYAIDRRGYILGGIDEWQSPILEGSLPDWLKFKQINSGYTLYTNGVLNKRGNFSTLEGEMGGLGGTMDQKMSSHPFYEKLFPMLNMQENRQFANVTGAEGEIQHFDVHYYHGMSDSDPNNTVNPTPNGSMIDNGGAWMVQMWNYYRQTGDSTYLTTYYNVMKTTMSFMMTKYGEGTHFPNYNTTYDDYSHPEMLIFSGVVWMNMLDIAADWATLMGEDADAAAWEAELPVVAAEVDLLYGEHQSELGLEGFYAFGTTPDYIASNGETGEIKSDIMFSGAMAGQFISRYSGLGDIVPFDQFVSHMKTFLVTSIQKTNDYYAPKVYNIRTDQNLDMTASSCWPFYLDSYGGMAAIQAGYLADGLTVLYHTMRVHLNLGYMWSQNLWTPGYATYMTAPVSWFLNDVLAGSALDVPTGALTLGPSCVASVGIGVGDELRVTLYYPKYWAEIKYCPAEGVFTYTITKTFYDEGEQPIAISNVVAAPAGIATAEASTIMLDAPFAIVRGAVLDLSAHIAQFEGETLDKVLEPVGDYEPPKPGVAANGSGLRATVCADGVEDAFIVPTVDLHYTKDAPPTDGVTGEYTLYLAGKLLPRYGQKYQLILEYAGETSDPEIYLDGQRITDYGTDLGDVESQQFTPTPDCKLIVYTVELKGDAFYPIEIRYAGDLNRGENTLRLLWWSTTQTMGTVIKERLYPPTGPGEWINGAHYTNSTAKIEGDHMAYTTAGSYALYSGIDFGTTEEKTFIFRIYAGAPDSEVSKGGMLEIRQGGASGKLLGKLNFTPTAGWADYQLFETTLTFDQPPVGTQDICLVFRPTANFLFNYTEWSIVAIE